MPVFAHRIGILCSGGLDSAVLLGDSLRHRTRVFPLFVRCGLFWEKAELTHLRRFLRALACDSLEPLTVLDEPIAEVYGPHWSITGRDVPDADTPDEAVFLPGRNVLLLGKTLLWCHLHDVPALALGSLQSNPFPDATPAFFDAFAKVVNRAVAGRVEIQRPFAGMKKKAVILLGKNLPLQHTFSCLQPIKGRHCGHCNKCAERKLAFEQAHVTDPTKYG